MLFQAIPLEIFSVVIPVIVQRVLGGVIDASSLLPRHIDVFHLNGVGCFIRDVQLCSMFFVMAMYEATTHAPKVFTVSYSKTFSSCSTLLLAGIWPRQG